MSYVVRKWAAGRVWQMLSYKAQKLAMKTTLQNEAYTSQECPVCLHRQKVKGKNYHCTNCGFKYHRDGVGSINIRRKYLNLGSVVGVMAPPFGVPFKPHIQRSPVPGVSVGQ